MARYIDADKVIQQIDKLQDSLASNNDTIWNKNKPIYKGLCNARGIINDTQTADVVPRRILFDLESKLHTMLPFKAHPIPIDGKCTGNSYELGQERVIYDILNYLGELEKKYTEGNHANH